MPFLRKYNTLTVTGTTAIRIPIIKRAVVDFAVGADWTPAAGDVKILIDGTAAANVANLPTAIAAGNTALWEFILTAAELSCKQCEVTIADSATKAIEDQSFIVETFGNASAMYQADLSAANLPANAVQLAGQAITAGAGVTFPSSVASPTNITAATGVDITKILGTAISAPATNGILDVNVKNMNNVAATPITTIKAVQGLATDGVIPTATNLTNAPTAGDFTGLMKASIGTAVAASAVASVTGNVGGSVGSVLGNVGGNVVGTVGSVLGAVASVTASVTITAASITAIWNEVLDGAFTARQLMRGYASALLSICSGMATGTGVFRDISNTKNRISATQDANGNRSAVTLDLT